MSDVSSVLRVKTLWAVRVAEACTWPKWANPLYVSPRPVSRELQGFPLKLYRCLCRAFLNQQKNSTTSVTLGPFVSKPRTFITQ